MIRNYIKIAFRNLWKERTLTMLNILGLTAAFGAAFLLGTYAFFELSSDQFHANKDTVYQIYTNVEGTKGTESAFSNPIPFAGSLFDEVPGIKHTARYRRSGASVRVNDQTHSLGTLWTDPSFFKMFTFPVAAGDVGNPLGEKSSIVLSYETAKRLYGDENPIGKTLDVPTTGNNQPVVVTAVLEEYPANSSIKVDAFLNFTNAPEWYSDNLDVWDNHNHEVYIQLEEGITATSFETSTKAFSDLHFADDMARLKRDGVQTNANGDYRQIKLVPLADSSFVTLDNKVVKVNKTLEYLILGIAFLILFIASVNFINMSIAKGAQRLREIGMRKTLGAGKGQLFFQFWGESLLVFLVSVCLGGLFAIVLLKPFQEVFRTEASFKNIANPVLIVGLIVSFLVITFIAGGYPAYIMSKLSTLQALKGKLAVNSRNKVRNVLMVLQFSIAILLISGTLVLWNQLAFMRSKDLGFNKEQVISIPVQGVNNGAKTVKLLRNELSNKSKVVSVTASSNILGYGRDESSSTSVTGFEHQGREVSTNILMVDYDYPETLDIELIAGRTFNRNYVTDSTAVIINETMAAQFTEKDPLDIVLHFDETSNYKVIGVLKDFHFQNLDRSIEPLSLFMNNDERVRYAYIRVAPGNLEEAYTEIESAWNKIEPDHEFLGSYLDENIDRTLRRERKMTTMITSGSILAIVLSCIGLFAISLLVVAQRRKEIGIRKVVGASVQTITILLTKDFIKLVCIAFVIATPVSWWGATQWLQSYSYRIDLSIWIFVASGAIALFIAAITIGTKTIRAALANPVQSLKTE